MSDYKEHKILGFKLILTELGIEAEYDSIRPQDLKQAMLDGGWNDPNLIALYETAWNAMHDLYEKLESYKL